VIGVQTDDDVWQICKRVEKLNPNSLHRAYVMRGLYLAATRI